VKGLALVLAAPPLFLSLAGCSPPAPVTAASGESIEQVSYEERFPLTTDVKEVTWRGERLAKAVPLMDRAGVTGMSGTYLAPNVVDRSTLVVTIKGAGGRDRQIFVKNCAEPHVCSFFAEASRAALVEKVPLVCREAVLCIEP
jgi:hypothetical protein